MNSHYRPLFSLPNQRILTTDRCSHCQINELARNLRSQRPVVGLNPDHFWSTFGFVYWGLLSSFVPLLRIGASCGTAHFRLQDSIYHYDGFGLIYLAFLSSFVPLLRIGASCGTAHFRVRDEPYPLEGQDVGFLNFLPFRQL